MMNPLLSFDTLPRFDRIGADDVAPAVDALLADAQAALDTVTGEDFAPDWQAMERVLQVSTEKLDRSWAAVRHLNSVADTPALRSAYNAALPRITEFLTRLGADAKLFAKYRAVDPARLNGEQRQARQNTLRDFVLGGAELEADTRERFASIEERLAQLSQKFSENTLDATDAFACYVGAAELDGVPEDVVHSAAAAARAEGRNDYKLTLKMPCYLPIMQYAQHRPLREKMYRAYVTRASDQAPAPAIALDNSGLIREILSLRLELAKLLGFANYAELSLKAKMAESPTQVNAFLRELAKQARPYAERDLADLREHAARHLDLDDPQAWDWPYVSEKLKQARYAFSEEEVRQYFPIPSVLAGLFRIVESLFEVTIRADQAPVWNEAVQFYRIERDGALLGQFYLDLSARTGKRGGAWMDDVRARWLRPDTGQLQTPVAHLVCNFAEGVDGKPALLTHDNVITLFHECGHGLHHLLTQVNEIKVSGINGVEWDAVELPSQFMENFCWQWEVLRPMTAHVQTGEPLPRSLFERMLAARNFQSGLQTLRQVEFALFDMLLHCVHDPQHDMMTLLAQVREEVAVIQPPAWNRAAHTFSHIFAGGYAAGYYSYKWAEVLSADTYAAFEETIGNDGLPNAKISRKYRQTILEAGGSRPAMDSFKAFRGREPEIEALLRHQGMSAQMQGG